MTKRLYWGATPRLEASEPGVLATGLCKQRFTKKNARSVNHGDKKWIIPTLEKRHMKKDESLQWTRSLSSNRFRLEYSLYCDSNPRPVPSGHFWPTQWVIWRFRNIKPIQGFEHATCSFGSFIVPNEHLLKSISKHIRCRRCHSGSIKFVNTSGSQKTKSRYYSGLFTRSDCKRSIIQHIRVWHQT